MKKFIFSIIAVLIAVIANAADTPDFAYPKKVSAQAEKDLATALESGNGNATVNALIRFGLAQTMTDNDNFPTVIAKIEEITAREKNPVTRALLNLLSADLYSSYYNLDRYNLDRRTSVEDPSADISLWSGQQFKEKIRSLYVAALADPEPLKNARLADFTDIIVSDSDDRVFYPTLFDFASATALENWPEAEVGGILQLCRLFLLTDYRVPGVMGKPGEDLMKIANDWVAANPRPSAPRIEALIKRMEALSPYVAQSDDDDNKEIIDNMIDLYNAESSTPYSVEILLSALSDYSVYEIDSEKKIYGLLTDFVKCNPSYMRLTSVENAIASIAAKSLNISCPRQVAKNKPFSITVSSSNVADAELIVYKVPAGFTKESASRKDIDRFAIVDRIPVSFDDSIPFTTGKSVKASFNDYGRYVIVPSFDGVTSNPYSSSLISCSDIGLLSWSCRKDLSVWSVDISSGRPVAGTEITVSSYRSDKKAPVKKTVGNDGLASFSSLDRSVIVSARKGDDRYGSKLNEWMTDYNPVPGRSVEIKTSLPVYHPGDTADFVTVAYSYDTSSHKILPATGIKIILYNTNSVALDTLDLVTDSFGRASGRFAIPSDGLTGSFSIAAFSGDDNLGRRWFMVSDYRLPTYTVSIDSVIQSAGSAKSATIMGNAVTYSGFPVADATVRLSLRGSSLRFWYPVQSPVFYNTETTTSADGSFAITLDDDVLSQSPYSGGAFLAEIVVTSPSGENRDASRAFSIGNARAVRAMLPGIINAADTKTVSAGIVDMLGNPVAGDITFTFDPDLGNDTISVSAVTTGSPELPFDFSAIPSGSYSLTISSPDARPFEINDLVIYRPDDKKSPVMLPVWTPVSTVDADPATRIARVTFAADTVGSDILMILDSQQGLIEQKWLTPSQGMNTIDVAVPDSVDSAILRLVGVRDLAVTAKTVTINVPDPGKELKITIESFRDKITPESDEKITIAVTDAKGSPRSAAVILDMYSKAIDAIATSSWDFTPHTGYLPWPDFSRSIGGSFYAASSARYDRKAVTVISVPEFNLYGLSFGSNNAKFNSLRVRGAAPIYGARMMTADGAVNEMAVEESADLQEVVTTAYGVVEQKSALTGSVAAVEEETADEEENGAPDEISQKDFNYRPSEIPLAFFTPSLSTGDDGRLTYSFTVPNANTTWVFNALAFDSGLSTATAVRQAIASRPLMVEPNLPRFLRRGDKAVILASVMNNSDSTANVVTVIEILDPLDMSVIVSESSSDVIAPRSSAVVSFDISADNDLQALVVRIRSVAGDYADGQQSLLPVLEASQPVIDSETFYLAPDEMKFETALPGDKKDSSTVVSFCENPAWEVVSALPGLRADNSDSSLSAAAALFSAAIARGILNDNPSIAPALRQWLDSAKDNETLLSMLDRNDDLKQMVLASTPWVEDAASDNERLTRLALILDPKSTSSAIDKSISALAKLERGNGGWAWISSADKPSSWATFHILHELGHLKSLGYLPADSKLDPMIRRALKFIDSEVAENFRKYPKSTCLEYVYVRGMFPDVVRSTGAQAATNFTVQRIVRDWKNYSPSAKAAAAIILHRDKYPTLANSLIESLREFSTYDPAQGMWWPSVDNSSWWSLTANAQTALILDAFNEVQPLSVDIDRIRQWLILNKQVQDWGNSVNTSAIVASILKCGSSWLNRPGGVTVAIDGKTVTPDRADLLTGKFIISADNADSLSILRTEEGPAWGAVVSRYTGVMSMIEAKSLPELSIVKETYVRRGDNWIRSDSLAVGDVAKVRLTIKSSRDMDYITVSDQRAACFEPVIQTPRNIYCDGLYFYLENRDDMTNLFIDRMPRGQYIVEYEMNVNNAGCFSAGIATVQSQYTPEMTAHSAGTIVNVKR